MIVYKVYMGLWVDIPCIGLEMRVVGLYDVRGENGYERIVKLASRGNEGAEVEVPQSLLLEWLEKGWGVQVDRINGRPERKPLGRFLGEKIGAILWKGNKDGTDKDRDGIQDTHTRSAGSAVPAHR